MKYKTKYIKFVEGTRISIWLKRGKWEKCISDTENLYTTNRYKDWLIPRSVGDESLYQIRSGYNKITEITKDEAFLEVV